MLRTLQERDFLVAGDDAYSYRLGPKVAAIGAAYMAGISLTDEGQKVVRAVARACDETVHLAVLRGTDVLYIAKQEAGGHMRMVSAIGRTIPAHATGVGKMLLAMLPVEEVERLYPEGDPLPRLTETTTTDRAVFLAKLRQIRAQDFATDDGESTLGVQCIAAPIRDASGATVAAMSVSVPAPRFTEARRPLLHAELMAGARDLSTRLGCPPALLPLVRTHAERR